MAKQDAPTERGGYNLANTNNVAQRVAPCIIAPGHAEILY